MALERKQFDVDACSTPVVIWLEIVFDCYGYFCELYYVRLTIIFVQPHQYEWETKWVPIWIETDPSRLRKQFPVYLYLVMLCFIHNKSYRSVPSSCLDEKASSRNRSIICHCIYKKERPFPTNILDKAMGG